MAKYIDYAWQHQSPSKIKALGCSGVMRYLSHDTSKDISHSEAQTLLNAGLAIGLVWESTASRAGAGSAAGRSDRAEAEKRADVLGFPTDCPIFMAVDYDASPSTVTPYFKGANAVRKRPVGVYGGVRVVDRLVSDGLATYGWQTIAWSSGKVSAHANLLQNKFDGPFDLNDLRHPFPVWKKHPSPPPGRTQIHVGDFRLGVKGSASVKLLQQMLNEVRGKYKLTFTPLAVDGWYGKLTDGASAAYQKGIGDAVAPPLGPKQTTRLVADTGHTYQVES